MINITEAAQEYLAELLAKQDVKDIAVRIFILDAGTPRAETCISFCRPGEEKADDEAEEEPIGDEAEAGEEEAEEAGLEGEEAAG